jgi:hypothetical protein
MESSDAKNENDNEWQVSSSKPRRLVPHHSLSRHDLEVEEAKSKAAALAAASVVKAKGDL